MRNKEGQSQNSQDAGVSDVDAFQLMAFAFGDDLNLMEEDAANEADVERFGRYEILGELGSGGMGVVYRAKEKGIEREVALKVLVAGRFSTQELRERFLLEYKTVARLEHESIVPIYAVGEVDGLPYMAMRLIDGHSLSEFMQTEVWKAYSVKEKVSLFHVVAEAVCYAHQRGVIHRDLKPSNLLIDKDGKPYLVDFGIAKSSHIDADLTLSGAVVGTPAYMAPEVLGNQEGGPTVLVDIYGLGALLYEMLTGSSAISVKGVSIYRNILDELPAKPSSLMQEVDRDLDTMILKCLEKRPEDRYASVQDLIEDVHLWLGGFPIQARKAGAVEKARKFAYRKPLVAAMSVLSILLLVAMAATFVVHSVRISRKNAKIQAQSVELGETHADLLEVRQQERERFVQSQYTAGISAMEEGDYIYSLTHWLELLKLEEGDKEREFLHRLRIAMLLAQCPRLLSDEVRSASTDKLQADQKMWGELTKGGKFRWGKNVGGSEQVLGALQLPDRIPENMEKLSGGETPHFAFSDKSKGYRQGWIMKSQERHHDYLIDEVRMKALLHLGDSLMMLSLKDGGSVLWEKWRQASRHCTSMAMSADGERILLGTENGHIEVLDSEDGELLKTFVWKDSPIVDLDFHASGALFLSGNESGEVVMWGMENLRPVGPWIRFPEKLEKLDFRKDGIVEVAGDERVQRWQFACLPVFGFNNATSMLHESFMLAQSKNGNGVFGMKDSKGKQVWVDYEANREVGKNALREVDWQPVRMQQKEASVLRTDGRLTVFIHDEGEKLSVKGESGSVLTSIGTLSEVTFVDFLFDGVVVVTGTRKGEVRLWSATTGLPVSPLLKNLFPVQDIRFNSENGHLAVVTEGYLPVWLVEADRRSFEELELVIKTLANGKGATQQALNAQAVHHWVRHKNSLNLEFEE